MGILGVKFFVNGRWTTVIIDHMLPCVEIDGLWQPIFCKPHIEVIPTPSHLLDRISPISSPKILVFCSFSPSRRGGSNEPKTGIQGQETVSRAAKHRFAGLANSGCSERMEAV